MRIWRFVLKEILYRKLSFLLGVISIAAAVGALVGAFTMLKAHDIHTEGILEEASAQIEATMADLNEDMRKATLRLGFNVVILPAEQDLGDWYTEDYGTKCMPEDYVNKLAQSTIVTVKHLLPSLQQKIKWPETKRTIILIGTRGEVPNMHSSPVQPLIQPVPEGTIVLGHELHQSMELSEGDSVRLMDTEFVVHKCHEERGSKDDITAWIHLSQAQKLLGKEGQINAILALECACAWADVDKVRSEIMAILPDTQVVEKGGQALARAEARVSAKNAQVAALEQDKQNRTWLRNSRESFASRLVVIVMAAALIWIGFLAFSNVRDRRSEIGILRAIGFRAGQILAIFLSKAVVMGLFGGLVGIAAGLYAGITIGANVDQIQAGAITLANVADPKLAILAVVLAPFLCVVASWIPSMIAAGQDPADILQQE